MSESNDKNAANACELSAMTLRAFMINSFEDLKGSYVLDSQIIIDWFYENLDLSLKDALEESDQCHKFRHEEKISRLKTDPTKIVMITRIKNRLTVIEFLQKSGKVNLDNNLKTWLEARKHFA